MSRRQPMTRPMWAPERTPAQLALYRLAELLTLFAGAFTILAVVSLVVMLCGGPTPASTR